MYTQVNINRLYNQNEIQWITIHLYKLIARLWPRWTVDQSSMSPVEYLAPFCSVSSQTLAAGCVWSPRQLKLKEPGVLPLSQPCLHLDGSSGLKTPSPLRNMKSALLTPFSLTHLWDQELSLCLMCMSHAKTYGCAAWLGAGWHSWQLLSGY